MKQSEEPKKSKWTNWHSAAVVAAVLLLGGGGTYAVLHSSSTQSSAPKASQTVKMSRPKTDKKSEMATKKEAKASKSESSDPVAAVIKTVTDGVGSGLQMAQDAVTSVIGDNPLAKAAESLATPKNTQALALANESSTGDQTTTDGKTPVNVDLSHDNNASDKPTLDPIVTPGGNETGNNTGTGTGTGTGPIVTPGGDDNSGSGSEGGTGEVTPTPNTAPTLSVPSGDVKVSLHSQAPDTLAGVTANDQEDGDLSAQVMITGNVDTSKVGRYTISYRVEDSQGLSATATRTFVVENDVPVLTAKALVRVNLNDKFDPLANVKATDVQDGDLTSAISYSGTVDTSKAGSYLLNYTVTDHDGATVTKLVQVDVTSEKVTFSGTDDVEIDQNADFDALAGVTVKDPFTPTNQTIEVTGAVDSKVPGEYTLTYTHTDKYGEKTTATRKVTVKAAQTSDDGQTGTTTDPSAEPTAPATDTKEG